MYNLEQAAIVKRGVEAWNTWRADNPLVKPYLLYLNIPGADLRGINFEDSELRFANFAGADMREANLTDARLNLANFMGTDLRNAKLLDAHLFNANLSQSRLDNALLTRAYLNRANLSEANLTNTNLRGAELTSANLRQADLYWSNLTYADLTDANLCETDLSNANLTRTSLRNTDFNRSIVSGTIFGSVDLSAANYIETIQHRGPSVIGIETTYLSKGIIPEIFLRGAGIPENFITYMNSLVGQPKAFEFYSCFISYSSFDQSFADRLYADLQARNVRCWFAPRDLRIGANIRSGIDEAIRIYDKLLIILSQNSIASEWVEHEVEAAYDRERHEKRLMLFPIRLDDSVMETNQGWAAHLRRTRHIGDFSDWKSHDEYRKCFDRLVSDLKSS